MKNLIIIFLMFSNGSPKSIEHDPTTSKLPQLARSYRATIDSFSSLALLQKGIRGDSSLYVSTALTLKDSEPAFERGESCVPGSRLMSKHSIILCLLAI
jgi:hypothetical protein